MNVDPEQLGRAMQKQYVDSEIFGQRRPTLACTSMQSDKDLYCPLTESSDTIECMNGEQISDSQHPAHA